MIFARFRRTLGRAVSGLGVLAVLWLGGFVWFANTLPGAQTVHFRRLSRRRGE